jgi:hypothetical protein
MNDIALTVAPPPGPEQFWTAMRDLTKRNGGFSWREIYINSDGVGRDAARRYVVACAKAGHIKQIDMRGREKIYIVTRQSAKTPLIVMRDGDPGARGQHRQHIWTAMRTLSVFTAREIAAAASTDEVRINVKTVERYIHQLRTAGLVTYMQNAGKSGASTYRLKPAANSGPRAPRILQARFVYDANLKKVVGDASTSEAQS